MLDEPRVREELAWAAGFFDGEGSVIAPTESRPTRRRRLMIGIAQVEPQPLERFDRATGSMLRVRRVVRPENPRAKPQWYAYTGRFENVQAIMTLIWPWLSEPKRAQFAAAMRAVRPADG